jgi:hypothetical protein
MRKIIPILAVALVISIMFTSSACGTNSSKLLGNWHISTGGKVPYGFPGNIEFFSDGTIVVDGQSGTYSIIDGKLKLIASSHAAVFDYNIQSTNLTLASSNEKIEYIKQ